MRYHFFSLWAALFVLAVATCQSSGGGGIGGVGGTGDGGEWCNGAFDGSVCGNGVCDVDYNEEGCCGDCETPENCPQDCTSCYDCACTVLTSLGGCADTCDNSLSGAPSPNFCNGAFALSQCAACIWDHCGFTPDTCSE